MLDNRIRSNSVLESFLGKQKERKAFSAIDYQYYFLMFVFKNQYRINAGNLLENEVILDFGNPSYLDTGSEYVYSEMLGINEKLLLTTYDNSNPTT